jgi:hypothetical protein
MIIDLKGPGEEKEREAIALRVSTDGLVVADEEEYAACGALLTEVRAEAKGLTAQRDSIVKPIMDGLKQLRALYKPALDSLAEAEFSLKKSMLNFRALQEKQRQIAERRAHAALAEGDHDEALAHIHTAAQAAPAASGVSARRTWKVRIADISKVPTRFLIMTADMASLRTDAKTRNWNDPPPGVEYYQEETLAVIGGT